MGLINTQLSTATLLTAGANIPVGNVVHKNCNNLSAAGTTWRVEGQGYYKITANVTVSTTAAGDITVTLSDNGVTVSQASATTAAAGDKVNLTLIGVVYNKCCCAEDALTLTISAAGTVLENDVIVERI